MSANMHSVAMYVYKILLQQYICWQCTNDANDFHRQHVYFSQVVSATNYQLVLPAMMVNINSTKSKNINRYQS